MWIANSDYPAVVEECCLHAAEGVAAAIDPGSRVLVVSDALTTLLC